MDRFGRRSQRVGRGCDMSGAFLESMRRGWTRLDGVQIVLRLSGVVESMAGVHGMTWI